MAQFWRSFCLNRAQNRVISAAVNMMGYPMLEIFGSSSPEVITTFYAPRKAPQHLYVTCIFVFKLFFQFLNSWWVFANEVVRFEEEITLAVICVSLYGLYYKRLKCHRCRRRRCWRVP